MFECTALSLEHHVTEAHLSHAGGERPTGRYRGMFVSPRELFTLPGGPGLWESSDLTAGIRYDVDARGERFLLSLAMEGPPPIMVAVGWEPAARE